MQPFLFSGLISLVEASVDPPIPDLHLYPSALSQAWADELCARVHTAGCIHTAPCLTKSGCLGTGSHFIFMPGKAL